MKFAALVFASVLSFAACSTMPAGRQTSGIQNEARTENRKPKTENHSKTYVLVELFTSEGCSSCPPADRVLARLAQQQPVENVEIVPLALHVDYWDHLGWRDPFSSAAFSARQTGYAEKFKLDSIYTPQMIVDGAKQLVGSEFDAAVGAVKESSAAKKASVELRVDENNLTIDISDLPPHDASNVWFVITEDRLQSDVRRGENTGRKLSHTAVVRDMTLTGELAENASDFSASHAIAVKPGWRTENLNLIVFVQGKNSKNIYAVGKKRLV